MDLQERLQAIQVLAVIAETKVIVDGGEDGIREASLFSGGELGKIADRIMDLVATINPAHDKRGVVEQKTKVQKSWVQND